MGRKDWEYVAIPREQYDKLDEIVKAQGRLYGIIDRNELLRAIIADFITRFKEKKDLMAARKMTPMVVY